LQRSDTSGCFRDPIARTASNPLGLNIIPQRASTRAALRLLNYFPLPNTFGGTAAALSTTFRKVRLTCPSEARCSLRHQAYEQRHDLLEVSMVDFRQPRHRHSGWPGNDNNRWGINSHYLYTDDGWSANWVRVINASVVNEFNLECGTTRKVSFPATAKSSVCKEAH
jgi:hypothetical protein